MLGLFTRSLDLKSTFVIWDFFMVKGDKIFLKIFYLIFKEIWKNYTKMNTN